jgi:hypothetical protein
LARPRTLQTLVARLEAIIWIWISPVEATVKRTVIAYPDVLPALKSQIERLRSGPLLRLSVGVSNTNHQQTSKEENLCSFRIHEQDISTRSRTITWLGTEDTEGTEGMEGMEGMKGMEGMEDTEGMDMDGMERSQTSKPSKVQTRNSLRLRRLCRVMI